MDEICEKHARWFAARLFECFIWFGRLVNPLPQTSKINDAAAPRVIPPGRNVNTRVCLGKILFYIRSGGEMKRRDVKIKVTSCPYLMKNRPLPWEEISFYGALKAFSFFELIGQNISLVWKIPSPGGKAWKLFKFCHNGRSKNINLEFLRPSKAKASQNWFTDSKSM